MGYSSILASYIVSELEKEFDRYYLSKNLINTIDVKFQDYGKKVIIDIPAQIYDVALYKKSGVILYKGGSYAQKINETGGYSGKHKGYVEKCISNAIKKFLKEYKINGKIK